MLDPLTLGVGSADFEGIHETTALTIEEAGVIVARPKDRNMTRSQSTNDRLAGGRNLPAQPALILVVDPDPDTCAMYVASFGLAGWIAEAVADGREALAKAISRQPAVVVTETRVPLLDGFELCRLLRRDPATRHIPILVVTGEKDARQIVRAKQAGADQVLIKPCLPDELARVVQAILMTTQEPNAPDASVPAPPATPPSGRRPLSRRHQRGETTTPPSSPPTAVCPRCDRRLVYLRSHIGGVNEHRGEQWDDYECPSGCGQFQYRHRTRKLRDLV
jgi:CheY-like chemotaxis protein